MDLDIGWYNVNDLRSCGILKWRKICTGKNYIIAREMTKRKNRPMTTLNYCLKIFDYVKNRMILLRHIFTEVDGRCKQSWNDVVEIKIKICSWVIVCEKHSQSENHKIQNLQLLSFTMKTIFSFDYLVLRAFDSDCWSLRSESESTPLTR